MMNDQQPRVEIVRSTDGLRAHGYLAWCPGCGGPHLIGGGAQWDGDLVRPTFAPAFSFLSMAFSPRTCGQGTDYLRCAWEMQRGQYHYLSQCTHHLRHATVDVPAWPLTFAGAGRQLV